MFSVAGCSGVGWIFALEFVDSTGVSVGEAFYCGAGVALFEPGALVSGQLSTIGSAVCGDLLVIGGQGRVQPRKITICADGFFGLRTGFGAIEAGGKFAWDGCGELTKRYIQF